jgi:hypothetical protein
MPQQPSYLQAGVPNNNSNPDPESKFIIDDGGDGLSSDDMCYVTNTTIYIVAFAQVSKGGQVVYAALNVEQRAIQLASDMLPPTIFMKMETAAQCLAHIRANAGSFLTPQFFQQNLIQEGSLPVIIELEYGYKFITEADRMRRQQSLQQTKPHIAQPNVVQQPMYSPVPQQYQQPMQQPVNYPQLQPYQQPIQQPVNYPQVQQPMQAPQYNNTPAMPIYGQPQLPNYPQVQQPQQMIPTHQAQQIVGYDQQGNPIYGQPQNHFPAHMIPQR